jgi:hypothetical protein
LINGKHGQGTHNTKMSADKLAENTPNAPKFICPLSPKAQKFAILMKKKASLGIRCPCFQTSKHNSFLVVLFCVCPLAILTKQGNFSSYFGEKHVKSAQGFVFRFVVG